MDKERKFSILVGAASSVLDGGKTQLAGILGISLSHLSKMINGNKNVSDAILSRLEEESAKILPPGFGFQNHVITDLTEIWSKETIVMAEAAAKMRGMSLEEYVKTVAREDLRPMFDGKGDQSQPSVEIEPLDGKEDDTPTQ